MGVRGRTVVAVVGDNLVFLPLTPFFAGASAAGLLVVEEVTVVSRTVVGKVSGTRLRVKLSSNRSVESFSGVVESFSVKVVPSVVGVASGVVVAWEVVRDVCVVSGTLSVNFGISYPGSWDQRRQTPTPRALGGRLTRCISVSSDSDKL